MRVKLKILLCSMAIIFIVTAPIFAQPQPTIAAGIGPPYNGFSVDNSDTIIFEFTSNPDTDGDVDIPMLLPASGSTFNIVKNSLPCPTNSPTGCFGSTMMYPEAQTGSITISGGTLSSFNVKVSSPVTPGTGFWQIDPPTNAAIQYIRTIPYISITYPAEVLSGETGIILDASATGPLYVGTITPSPAISSQTWTQVANGSPLVTLTGSGTLSPFFDAPSVTVDTDLVFQLSVTDNAGLTATKTITVTVLARDVPMDVVLLLDTSGSMGWHATGSANDLTGGCCSRLASAKNAAQYFIDRLGVFASDSRVGVAIFPAEPGPGTNYGDRYAPPTDLATSSSFTTIKNNIGGSGTSCGTCASIPAANTPPAGSIQVNWNGTPTQYGLDAARTMLTSASGSTGNSRVIVLLSDGAWNVGTDPTDSTVINPLVTAGIRVYTIGMGTGFDNVNHTSLQDISSATNTGTTYPWTPGDPFGFTNYNLGDSLETNLFPFFEKVLAHMVTVPFNADPPAIIQPGKTNIHKVLITSHDSLVSFTVSWESSMVNLLDITVITPNGTRLKPQVTGNGYSNITVGGRLTDNFSNIGEWIIEVMSKSSRTAIPYNYSVMSKSDLNMKILLNKDKFYTGDTMLLEARLIEDNIRLKGATVKAKVKRPETGIGNWHVKHTVSQNQLREIPDEISGEPLSLVDKKNYVLSQQQKIALPEIITEPEIILNDEGIDGDKYADDGIYTAQYNSFIVPGIYKFQISADGTTENEQVFHRENEVQKYVDIIPDSTSTIVEGDIQITPKDEAGIMTIQVTPLDGKGNYLGPGYADKIIITSSEGKPTNKVEDMLNGTYQQQFIVHDGTDPHVTIIVRDEQVYNGPYSEISDETDESLPYKWELSIHAGFPILHGSSEFHPGISGILDLNYQITNFLSAELLAGCHYFFEDENGDSFYWLNASLNAKMSIPMGMAQLFVNGGTGVYIMQETWDQYVGWNVGGGIAFPMSIRSHIELGYNYHNISHTENNEFSVIQLGVRFGF